jgi:hypothetical protein
MVELEQMQVRYVRRGKDEPEREVHYSQRQGYVTKVMFWGAITIFGPGCLVPVRGMMNAEKYMEILHIHLLPLAERVFGAQPWKLLQDGARCHTAKKTAKFLQLQGIQTVEWPSYSPDMNAIENVWSVFKRKLYREGSGSSIDELLHNAQRIWEEDDDLRQAAMNCVLSMQTRVRKLFDCKGGHTHY